MSAKGDRREKPIAGDPSDLQGMHVMLKLYFESLLIRNYSKETIQKHRLQLNDFIRWCAESVISRSRVRLLVSSSRATRDTSCVKSTSAENRSRTETSTAASARSDAGSSGC